MESMHVCKSVFHCHAKDKQACPVPSGAKPTGCRSGFCFVQCSVFRLQHTLLWRVFQSVTLPPPFAAFVCLFVCLCFCVTVTLMLQENQKHKWAERENWKLNPAACNYLLNCLRCWTLGTFVVFVCGQQHRHAQATAVVSFRQLLSTITAP